MWIEKKEEKLGFVLVLQPGLIEISDTKHPCSAPRPTQAHTSGKANKQRAPRGARGTARRPRDLCRATANRIAIQAPQKLLEPGRQYCA